MEKELDTFQVPGSSAVRLDDDKNFARESEGGNDSSRFSDVSEASSQGNSRSNMEKGSKKMKGRSAGSGKTSTTETDLGNQDSVPIKSKKGHKKGKDTSRSSETKASKEENLSAPSHEWIVDKVSTLVPDFEEQGLLSMLLIFHLHVSLTFLHLLHIFETK